MAAFVHHALCEADALDPAQTPLFRTPLQRGGRVCGVVFHVEGPRLLRTSAVWSADDDRAFADRMGRAGFTVKTERATVHAGGGGWNTLFLGRLPSSR